MARRPRENVEGIHHVYARGNDGRVVFLDDVDRRGYLAMLGQTVRRKRWCCLAYCLMTNHVHLLVETPEPNLSRGIQRLHGSYGKSFNERHNRKGHLFEGRFGSTFVTSDEQLWWTIAYIANNPVEAGLCQSADAWQWSSHAALATGRAPEWVDRAALLRCFEGAGGDPRRRYAEIVG